MSNKVVIKYRVWFWDRKSFEIYYDFIKDYFALNVVTKYSYWSSEYFITCKEKDAKNIKNYLYDRVGVKAIEDDNDGKN